jgi:hypothetical protein
VDGGSIPPGNTIDKTRDIGALRELRKKDPHRTRKCASGSFSLQLITGHPISRVLCLKHFLFFCVERIMRV